jgi:hypothetical protein
MENVWIRLTMAPSKEVSPRVDNEEIFMFGTGGIVHFMSNENGDATILLGKNRTPLAVVLEDKEYIMNMLLKVRGTGKLVNGKQGKKTNSKSKASSRKAKSKV